MLYRDEIVYRPPMEAVSALLEVAYGCSHGRCTFCRYTVEKEPLQLKAPETLEADLRELALLHPEAERVFLLGGNVLAFKTAFILGLFESIREYMPGVHCVSMYARATDITAKSDAQLRALKQAGLGTLYVGLESGSDTVLARCNKGVSSHEMFIALQRLNREGIPYGLSAILGLGGVDLWSEHIEQTASLVSRLSPESLRVTTLSPIAKSPLDEAIRRGEFVLQSDRAIVEEEVLLLENIHLTTPCLFAGTHVSNEVPVLGWLPDDKLRLLSELKAALRAGAPRSARTCGIW